MRLLLAEDERELADALVVILKHNHYSVDAVYNGQDALDYLEGQHYDGAILDIMMPRMDGLTVLRTIRSRGNHVPVLLLTAKSGVDDRVEGLDSGANDYLPKPFDTRELLARVRAMTRVRTAEPDNVLRYGNITLDRSSFELTGPEGSVRLGNKEFQMLEMLMTNPGQVLAVERFMERVWGYDSDTETSVVWVNISYLRKKLAALGADVQIKAMRNQGYLLEQGSGNK
jgi:DNA-binding response OmpR family regulator